MDFVEIFNDSYERNVGRNHDKFFKTFYENFTNKSPEISKAFANTDMQRQISMLQHSIMMMIDFASNHASSEFLENLARFHNEKKISAEFYSLWLEAIIDTLQQIDPEYTASDALSWKIMMSAGIEFMKGFDK